MRKYICFLLLISIWLLTLPVKASLPLLGKIIVVDPGHGGKDPGTISGDIYEKNLNLQISLELEKELNKLGATVLLTREGDYDLSSANAIWRKKSDFDNRIKYINESGANLYLSIHLNYLEDSKYSGIQVFGTSNNINLAKVVQENLNKSLKSNRKAKLIPVSTYMYSKLKPEGLLIECGFLSNKKERNLLVTSEYQKKVASEIATSITKILI